MTPEQSIEGIRPAVGSPSRRHWLGCGVIAGAVVAWAAWVLITNAMGMYRHLPVPELSRNLKGIREAELRWHAAHGEWVPAGTEATALSEISGERLHEWVSGPGWERLGWRPDGDPRGGYWVELRPDGFLAVGVIDADGDGTIARYEATESFGPRLVTDPDVY